MPYYLITFSNTHTAIATQKFLTGKLDFVVMPTLREISNSCGISLKIPFASLEEIEEKMRLFTTDASMYRIYLICANDPAHISISTVFPTP